MAFHCSQCGKVIVPVAGQKCGRCSALEEHEKGPKDDVSSEKKCPLKQKKKIKLVEVVEVVTRAGNEGTVVGATPESKEKKKLVDRTATSGVYKQFINLDKDIEGADKRHPEFGRYIELKARVEWEDGKKKDLADKEVHWSFDIVKGKDRNKYLKTGLTDIVEKENGYFENGKGPKKDTFVSTTDDKGWTNKVVKFFLSQYGGDKFTATAQAAEENKGKPSGKKIETGEYVVWKEFWYQMTYDKGFVPPKPEGSITSYRNVCTDMMESNKETFSKKDVKKPDNTYYPEYMVKAQGAERLVAVIGKHNEKEFQDKLKKVPGEPVKAHLMVCEYQWDPKDSTGFKLFEVKSNPSRELTIPLGRSNYGLVKPALEGDLVLAGSKWQVPKPGFFAKIGAGFMRLFSKIGIAKKRISLAKSDNLNDNCIKITKNRKDINCFRVEFPGYTQGTLKYNAMVKINLNYGAGYLGDSKGYQITTVYREGGSKGFANTVTHEIGHAFWQVPWDPDSDYVKNHPAWFPASKFNLPDSMAKHPNQYDNTRGGSGSHCHTGATDRTDINGYGHYWYNGTCVMYHAGDSNAASNIEFCDVCKPYLKLQDMQKMKEP